ncbi:MAG TPA: hypothetical protein VGB67_04110 [Fibrella sp.]|jgi:hypothetical protein
MEANEQLWIVYEENGIKTAMPFSQKAMEDHFSELQKEADRRLFWPAPTNEPVTISQWPVHYKLHADDQTKTGVLLGNDWIYDVSTEDNPNRTDLYQADLNKPICNKNDAAIVRGFTSMDF